MTTPQAYSLGYLIAAIIIVPLVSLAKTSGVGLLALATVTIVSILCCIAIRVSTGQWP